MVIEVALQSLSKIKKIKGNLGTMILQILFLVQNYLL